MLPGLHPLVVDDVVLLRTYKNLLAVDFTSGKRLWEVPVDDSQENSTVAGDIDSSAQTSLYGRITEPSRLERRHLRHVKQRRPAGIRH